MSTALAQRAPQELVSSSLTPDQIGLVKRQLMSSKRAATDDELALFIYQCDRTGLDPFADQIYAIFRWDGRAQQEKMRVQVSIHGLRLIADRTRAYAPGRELWCGQDGVWRDVWLEREPPKAAKVSVFKIVGGQALEFSVPATWSEYAPYKDGKLTGLWPTKPALMLAKCSEALALRRAFPNDTSGLYTTEEMAQADAEAQEVFVANVRDAFDATEVDPDGRPLTSAPKPKAKAQPKPSATEDPDVTNRTAAPADAGEVLPNPADPVSEEDVAQMVAWFDQKGVLESTWRMRLMLLDASELTDLTRGQARDLMMELKPMTEAA
jgi:phage recombination protein Bet